jgi:hypothetical protein
MNDDELAAAVKESVRGAHMNIPAEQIVHRSRAIRARRRIPALVGGLTAGATAVAAGLVLTSGPGAVPAAQGMVRQARTVVTAAWTVREDANGTVTIYLRQYANPARLQQTLRADGVNAIVRRVPVSRVSVGLPGRPPDPRKQPLRIPRPTCVYAATNDAPASVQRAVVTFAGPPTRIIIHQDAMPPGSALLLPFMAGMPVSPKNGNTGTLAWPPVVLNNDTVPACVPDSK